MTKRTYDYGRFHVCGEQMKKKRINQDFWGTSQHASKGSNKLIMVESVSRRASAPNAARRSLSPTLAVDPRL
jgi:hypothetical protein